MLYLMSYACRLLLVVDMTWSGLWDSNPCLQLGRMMLNLSAKPAHKAFSTGLEPAIPGFGGQCSIQLSHKNKGRG